MPEYTTEDKVGRKLRGRLNIQNPMPLTNIAGYGQTVASQIIDPDLLTEVIDQEESYMNLCLAQFYVYPLRLTSTITVNILNQIADDLIVSQLLQIHFEGSNPMNGAADTGNMISDMRRQGELLLAKVTAGMNVFNSTQPAPINSNLGMIEIQPLVLPEEIPLTRGQRPDLITRNYSVTEVNEKANDYRKKFDFLDLDDCRCGAGRGVYEREKDYYGGSRW